MPRLGAHVWFCCPIGKQFFIIYSSFGSIFINTFLGYYLFQLRENTEEHVNMHELSKNIMGDFLLITYCSFVFFINSFITTELLKFDYMFARNQRLRQIVFHSGSQIMSLLPDQETLFRSSRWIFLKQQRQWSLWDTKSVLTISVFYPKTILAGIIRSQLVQLAK